jgi:hypothetical protein
MHLILQLLGATEPHLNSSDLVAITLAANKVPTKVDTSWDAADHPENWYGRSDHLPMLKLMYQYFLPLYYTLTTIPLSTDKIDYVKLTKMTKWIYETGWRVAQSAKRPFNY